MSEDGVHENNLGVIPARLGSTRLARKPLCVIHGKTLLQRVWERATQAKTLSRVVIATDSEEIQRLGESFGAEVVMTSETLGTGSERVLQAARLCGQGQGKEQGEDRWGIVVNIQGDMPFVEPGVIDTLVNFLHRGRSRFSMATIAVPLADEESFLSRHVVKAVVSDEQTALYFSRAPIPFPRDESERGTLHGGRVFGYKHIGLYAFLPEGLRAYDSPEQSSLERIEKLEQLRVLERGQRIGVSIVDAHEMRFSVEVDTAEDLRRAEEVAKVVDAAIATPSGSI